MKKKALSLLLTLAMLLSLVPAMGITAAATTARTETLSISTLDGANTQGSVKNGEIFTNSDEGWVWDRAHKVLTIEGLTINCTGTGIKLPGGSTIVVKGTNTINVSDEKMVYGITATGDLTVSTYDADAKLTVVADNTAADGDSYGIIAYYYKPEGKSAQGVLTVNGNGSVEVTADTNALLSTMTKSQRNVVIGESVNVTATLSSGSSGAAIRTSNGTVYIKETATVTTNYGGCGIQGEAVEITTAGTVTVNDTTEKGIWAKNGKIKISKATLSIDGGKYGLYAAAGDVLTTSSAKVTIKDMTLIGTYASGAFSAEKKSKVTVRGCTDREAKGITADTVVVDGATLDVSINDGNNTAVDNDGDHQYAIQAQNSLTIGTTSSTNPSVTSRGGAIGVICSTGTVSISAGVVDASAGITAIWAKDALTISGGTVKAVATEATDTTAKAIYASEGDIVVSGNANVTATGKNYGIRAANGNITLGGYGVVAAGGEAAFSLKDGKELFASGMTVTGNTEKDGTSGTPVEISVASDTGKMTNFETAKYVLASKGITTKEDLDGLLQKGGYGVLAADITLSSILTVNSGVKVTLNLNNCVIDGNDLGSVITNKGTLYIVDNNTAATTRYFTDSDGDGCFEKLETSYDPADKIEGKDYVKAVGGVITGGNAAKYGGAIYNIGTTSSPATLVLSGGNIVGNKASVGGGVYSDKASFTLEGGKIVGNLAKSDTNTYGGGLYLNSVSALSGGEVSFNTSVCEAAGQRAYGGGIHISSAAEIDCIDSMTIRGNTAKATNGCLLAFGGGIALMSGNTITINNCTVNNNKVLVDTADGGENTVAVRGGGIYCSCNLTMSGTTIISDNTAENATAKNDEFTRHAFGGGICLGSDGVELTIADPKVKISNNAAVSTYKAQGGGVYMSSNCKFTMTAGTISENSVEADTATYDEAEGGGVCVTYSTSVFTVGGTAKITGNTGTNNCANNVYLRKDEGKEAVITVGTGNNAPVSTGAEKMSIGVTVAASYKNNNGEYKDTVFPQAITQSGSSDFSSYFTADDNTGYEVRNYKNGAIQLVKLATKPAVCEITSEGNFKDNQYSTIAEALTDAGTTETTIKLLRDVTENVTIIAGADITLDLNGKVLDLNGKHIVNKGTLTIADSNPTATHTDALADYAGGVITGGSGTDSDKVLDGIGGAIVVVKDGSNAALTMSAGTIVNCSAANGGAIFVGEGASFTMNGGKIVKCSAERGGGISNYKGIVTIAGTVDSCKAKNYGGGIYNDGDATAKVTLNKGADIKNCEVLNGTENDLLGGGVYNKGTLIMNTGAVIEGCSAEKGAGVHNDGNDWVTFTMTGGEIKNNTAKRTDGGKSTGGGVQVSANSTFTMTGGSITGNKTNATTQYGAGVYNKGTMTVGGTANITGNLHSNGITASNLCVATGKTVAVSTETVPTTMSVGISTETDPLGGAPVRFGAENSTNYSSHFTSDVAAYSVVYEETTGTKDLKLKQTIFYVSDDLYTPGNDITGNGTSAKPYLNIEKAAAMANGTGIVKLLSGRDIPQNATLPDNTTIAINGKTVRTSGPKLSGNNITVLIYNVDDFTAANSFVKCLTDETTCTFKLMNDIEIGEVLKLNGNIGNVIFDGNGKTITANGNTSEKSAYVFSVKNEATSARNFTLKNITIDVNNGFRYALYLQGENATINATVENVIINMNQTVAPRNSSGETTTVIIMDNGADITIKGNFISNTNQFCWAAINLDASKRNASLTFDSNANVSITDNRTASNKAAEMFIAFDGNTTNTCTASGKFITDNLVAAGTKGYNPPVTVTFNSNGGSDVAPKINAQYWYVEKPQNPAKTDYTFGGWYSDEACENAWNFANDKVTNAITLYAKWIKNSETKAVVTGTVTDDGSDPVAGAVVELRLGAEKVAAANTNASGEYTFDHVENGFYNIAVTKDGKTKTTMVNVNEASSFTVDTVVLSSKEVSSKIELKNTATIAETAKANVASIVVGGVDAIAEAITPSGTDKITVTLTVEPKTAETSNTQQMAIKAVASGKTVEFLNLTLTKQVNDAAPSDIGDTNDKLLTILVPFDFTGIDTSSIIVYRYHGTKAETFTKIKSESNKADATYMVGDDYITIFAEKFSTYAIGYTDAVSYSGGTAVTSYAVTLSAAAHGSVEISPKSAVAGRTVTITVTPDKGYTLETLTVKDAKGNEIELTAKEIGKVYTFRMPASKVTVTATFMEDNTMLNFFVDVKASDYFYDAVLWAATNGITSGVDSTHFAPNAITTRGQMVTFLWRAAGSPEPTTTTCSFTDVKASEYYYKAVLWGIENGYVKGISETEFAPDMTVTRGQCVTFLARMNGVKDEAASYTHRFTDVKASDYYNNAVAWAATNKITTGATATTFDPNSDCTRGQIVTFIYRNFVK